MRRKGKSSRSRYLFKLFMALRLVRHSGKWRFISATKVSQTCFEKLDKLLNEAGITDELGFILAQLRYWGVDKTYPQHLITPYAVNIYYRWKEEQVPISKGALKQEEKMLQDLCQMREETEEEVIQLLKDSGVFSQKFLHNYL